MVTFSHLGRADARLLLAATPALLIAQMLALPGYLGLFLGDDAARLVQAGPFLHAFVWLIAVPLALAAATQWWAARSRRGASASAWLGLLPVPATALVLFVVIASVLPQLGPATQAAWSMVPVYAAFAVAAPALGWLVARAFGSRQPRAAPSRSARARATPWSCCRWPWPCPAPFPCCRPSSSRRRWWSCWPSWPMCA
ncbi:hypothetical protein GY14_00615 [Delftia tsuruhatensis]|nr:hypothetical protein GY14_00615 [Delftia tsuruhatensis]